MNRAQLVLAVVMAALAGSFLTLAVTSERLTAQWSMRYAAMTFVLTATNLILEVHCMRRGGSRGQVRS